MLIDSTHPEETRVVVLRGNRVEEFDFESANRRQLRGNIYLAKVTRVEPSLQAAFVDYGGNRHGFLAFSEIHPDYYQIPVADRQALIEEDERAHLAAEAEADRRARRHQPHRRQPAGTPEDIVQSEPVAPEASDSEMASGDAQQDFSSIEPAGKPFDSEDSVIANNEESRGSAHEQAYTELASSEESQPSPEPAEASAEPSSGESANGNAPSEVVEVVEEEVVESVGGDELEEAQERMPRMRRQYKIQEVIKRRQVMLVQVVKEERGTKGAALTTYLSLAGRYSVLMPNTARGGGISRKITSVQDRRRLKELVQELEVPEGMGVILRTAGATRNTTDIQRDFEYLLRLWETVRDLTLNSTAPKLVYEEGSLIKRSIRDLYGKEIDEVIVAGDDGYREARDFMRMLMPSHEKSVKFYRDTQPLFTRHGIESQLDAMFTPVMQLRSGGYIVLNQTEALVSIDVNSGRATREHHIEDTALKTNSEAAEEIARQLRLRDLAGLIVIDFIDMDEKRNNRAVERRLKECLKHDRARIQVGGISHFGLLEMSRQRIRTSVLESSTETCPHCGGLGHVRSVSSVTLQLLRVIEETLLRGATHNLIVRTRPEIALYVLNHKRSHLRDLEARFHIMLTINTDPTIGGQQPFVVEKGEQVHTLEQAKAFVVQPLSGTSGIEGEEAPEGEIEAVESIEAEGISTEEAPYVPHEDGERGGQDEHGEVDGVRKRRRRRRGRRGSEGPEPAPITHDTVAEHTVAHEDHESLDDSLSEPTAGTAPLQRETGASENGEGGEVRRRKRRGRRGGRRSRRDREGEAPYQAGESAGSIEPEVHRAVADFDSGPPAEPMRAEPPRRAEPIPAPARIEMAREPVRVEPAAPRRRSTVREPAPVTGEYRPPAKPMPAAELPAAITVIGPGAGEDSEKPRRPGWWSRRFGGGDQN
jgi:ribonuclease E